MWAWTFLIFGNVYILVLPWGSSTADWKVGWRANAEVCQLCGAGQAEWADAQLLNGSESDQRLSRSRCVNERPSSLKSLGKPGRHFWAFANPPAAIEVASGRSKLQVKTQSFLNSSFHGFHYILYPEFRLKLSLGNYYILRIDVMPSQQKLGII